MRNATRAEWGASRRPAGGSLPAGLAVAAVLLAATFWVGECYPFSRMHLYAFGAANDSRLVLELPGGQLSEVFDHDAIRCEGDVSEAASAPPGGDCEGAVASGRRDGRVAAWVATRPAAPLETLTRRAMLVRQVFWYGGGAPPEGRILRCPLVPCWIAEEAP